MFIIRINQAYLSLQCWSYVLTRLTYPYNIDHIYWPGGYMLTMVIRCTDQADLCSPCWSHILTGDVVSQYWSYILTRLIYAHHGDHMYLSGRPMLNMLIIYIDQDDLCYMYVLNRLTHTHHDDHIYRRFWTNIRSTKMVSMNKRVPVTLARDSPTPSIAQPRPLPLPRPNHSSFPTPSPDPSPPSQKVWRTLLHSMYVLWAISANLRSWKMKFLVLDTYYTIIRIKQLN